MQNSPIKSEFEKASTMPEAERYALIVEQINSQRVSSGFKEIKERQRLAIEAEKERFETERPEALKILTQSLLDERIRNLSPHLRPKHFAGPDRRSLEQAASHDAAARLAASETEHLKAIEDKFLIDQKRFVERAKSAKDRQSFNRAARGAGEKKHEHGYDDGPSGHSR